MLLVLQMRMEQEVHVVCPGFGANQMKSDIGRLLLDKRYRQDVVAVEVSSTIHENNRGDMTTIVSLLIPQSHRRHRKC